MQKIQHKKWSDMKKELLTNDEVAKYLKNDLLEYEIARAIINARLTKGFTQKKLAQTLNTKQSVISRVENAKTIPSLSFLKRLAIALDAQLKIELKT